MILEDRRYLIDIFPEFTGRDIFNKEVLNAYYKVEKIIKGYDEIKRRGCNCQYGKFQKEVDNLYNNWLHEQKIGLHNPE